MKNLLLFIFLVASCAAFAQVPSPSTPWLMNEQGYISKDNPLPVDAEITLGDITIEDLDISVTPSFVDAENEPASSELDADGRVIVNLASDTIGLLAALSAIVEAMASETVLLSGLSDIKDAVEALEIDTSAVVGAIEALEASTLTTATELATDSIGLITAIEDVKTAIEGLELTAGDITVSSFNDGDSDQKGLVDSERRVVTSLGSESIGLLSVLAEIRDSNASETALLSAIGLVETAVANLDLPATDGSGRAKVALDSDDIGLVAALAAIEQSNASETALLDAIGLVKAAVEGLELADLDASNRAKVAVEKESIGLIDALEAIAVANASETVLLGALSSLQGAVEGILQAKTELATDSIGLVSAIDDVKTAVEALDISAEASFNDGTSDQKALVDASRRVVTSLAHDGIGLVEAVQAMPAELASRKISLTADTAQSISSALTGDRLYIEVTTMSDEAEIWVDFGKAAVVGESRRVVGGIGIKLPKVTAVSVVASETMDIFVLEGGK